MVSNEGQPSNMFHKSTKPPLSEPLEYICLSISDALADDCFRALVSRIQKHGIAQRIMRAQPARTDVV